MPKIVHVSLKDIRTFIGKYHGEEQDYQNNTPSVTSKALQMFKENKSRIDVAIALNLQAEDAVTLFEDYLSLINFDRLMTIYKDLGNDAYLLYCLFHHLKWEGIATKDGISNFLDMAGRLIRLDEELLKLCEQLGRLNDKKSRDRKNIKVDSSLLRYLRSISSNNF